MAENSQNIKYVKLDDGVSFSLVRTNPKLTTNTKLMYNGSKMYMESYASSELMNRAKYKNVSIKQNSTYNKDIARFLTGSGSQAYNVYQNFSNVAISDSYDNQYETLYWCGAEYIDSSFYSEEIGFVAPLYLREKLPNYFLIFRIDTPSNYNFNKGDYDKDGDSEFNDPTFDFKTDILDKAVLLKTFDLREGSVLGNYIHNYIDQDAFEFDKSMYVNFSNAEVTYYGINKNSGVLEKKVENFENELLKNDNPVFVNDKWFTEGFERNGLIFPYIMNIEYLFDDDTFKQNGSESFDFARYIGVYCNNIEFGEFGDFSELEDTKDDVIYYFEDNQRNLHRYVKDNSGLTIDGKPKSNFDKNLISGFEKEKITAYAEPLDIYEGFINRTRYEFEILKPFEPGDWIGISYNNNVEYYYADDKNFVDGEYSDFRFYVGENSSLNDIAESFVKCVNRNKNGICEVKCSGNLVVLYVKEGNEKDEENVKIHIDSTLIYNKKIATFNNNEYVYENGYYEDSFCKTFNVYIDKTTETYKNVFKIYANDYVLFGLDRYLKTNNGNGRKISANMIYVNAEGEIEPEYRIVVVENVGGKENSIGYNISVSSTYQVEIMDKFKPNYGVLSWFPVKDFDFDINYSSYGKYDAFIDECNILSEKIKSKIIIEDPNKKYDSIEIDSSIDREKIKKLAKSHFVDDYNNPLESEYEYYYEQYHPDLCLISKSVPYVSKWGYYDEQKDSCENPYRLNVSKVFGVSNLSANINSIKCDEKEYTHNMPYYMTFDEELDYSKNYQYIESDEYYKKNYVGKTDDGDINGTMDDTKTFDGCVNYWIDKFKKTDEDMFSHFFSGKKYGKRFDRKYSRLLGGDKFHNPSTLFRGVKFEVIRQYNGVEKRSSEYNNYRFSFIYIPVMNESLVFKNTVYFVKNDTFKFIVGIILVNTMLGKYNHNIFNKKLDYFNKGFVYAACKDLIRPINTDGFEYQFVFSDNEIANVSMFNDFCKVYKSGNFYMWEDKDPNKIIENRVFITATNEFKDENDIIGAFNVVNGDKKTSIENIQTYEKYKETYKENCIDNIKFNLNKSEQLKLSCVRRYDEYDVEISAYTLYDGSSIKCIEEQKHIIFKNMRFVDICEYDHYKDKDEVEGYYYYSKFRFKSDALRNNLVKLGKDCVHNVTIYDNGEIIEKIYGNDISVNDVGDIEMLDTYIKLKIKDIDNLVISIEIIDKIDEANGTSLFFKNYFSTYEQISIYNIMESINNDYNVKYYCSTVDCDGCYKIRVVEPDIIKIDDKYESVPVEITQNNKSVIGSVEIKTKQDVDKIGVKTINRYSGFYNPIFNDILYYDDINIIVDSDDNDILELPYSNTKIDYNYTDEYGKFGVIKNMYYHKTNIERSDKILSSNKPIYPVINEYALNYRDYNIFSSSWDEGYFITQDDLDTYSVCEGIGSMKDGCCMFGSKYLNLPDDIFVDTFENGELWDENLIMGVRDNTDLEIMYKEINNRTVRYHLFIEKRLKRYLKDMLIDVFSKYINKEYSFGNKGTIEDDVNEYVEKNILKLYKVDKIYMYIKSEPMKINDKQIENEYLKYMSIDNDNKINDGFSYTIVEGKKTLKNNQFIIIKNNEFDRTITYNLKPGFKESFGFGVSFKRK